MERKDLSDQSRMTRGAQRGTHVGGRLALPLIGHDEEPKVEMTKADIQGAFDAEHIERYGKSHGTPNSGDATHPSKSRK